jgi:hypothetical protein
MQLYGPQSLAYSEIFTSCLHKADAGQSAHTSGTAEPAVAALEDFMLTQNFGGFLQPEMHRLDMRADIFAKIGDDKLRKTNLQVSIVKAASDNGHDFTSESWLDTMDGFKVKVKITDVMAGASSSITVHIQSADCDPLAGIRMLAEATVKWRPAEPERPQQVEVDDVMKLQVSKLGKIRSSTCTCL